MDGIIIDGKRYNADEVADMLHDNDDDEVVGIPNNGDQSDDEKEWADEEPDELIDETQLPHRVRNRAERDYPILDEGEISDEFLNADELDISILEASGIAVPDIGMSMSLDLSVVTQETSSPPRKRMLVSSTPVEDALFDQNDKLGRVREECCKYKDVVVDLTSNDFERARWKKKETYSCTKSKSLFSEALN